VRIFLSGGDSVFVGLAGNTDLKEADAFVREKMKRPALAHTESRSSKHQSGFAYLFGYGGEMLFECASHPASYLAAQAFLISCF
jgi:hypothetical protein